MFSTAAPLAISSRASAAVGPLTAVKAMAEAATVIDLNELRAAFEATASQMPETIELVGVTFHGSGGQREWVAFAQHDGDPGAGCEGWGDTPFEALDDLLRHVRDEH